MPRLSLPRSPPRARRGLHHPLLLGHPPMDPGLESVGRALNLACLCQHRPGLDSSVPLTFSGPKAPAAHPNPRRAGSEGSASLLCSFRAYPPRLSPLRLILAKAAVQPRVGGSGTGSQPRPRPRPAPGSEFHWSSSDRSRTLSLVETWPCRRRGWGGGGGGAECGARGGKPDWGPGFHCLDKRPCGRPTFSCKPWRSRGTATGGPTACGRLHGGAVRVPRA